MERKLPNETNKRHPVYEAALERNKERPFSVFRTQSRQRITIWPNFVRQGEKPSLRIVVEEAYEVRNGTLIIGEQLLFYENGDCNIMPEAKIPGVVTKVPYSMEGRGGFREYRYKEEQINRPDFIDGQRQPSRIKHKLDLLESALRDVTTVRVDPYNFERVLPEENTAYDREIGQALSWLDESISNLPQTPEN